MYQRLGHYLKSLAFLSGLAVAYQAIVNPWMQPPDVEVIAMAEDSILQADDSLKDVFADGAWQRGPCKQLQTASGMLLFQNWEQTADDQWKLWPVTVVIGRGMSGASSQSAVIMDAVEGAELKFTESLDVMSGGAPPIHRGRMIGSVHIYRKAVSDESEAIDIRTANVGIDSRKIWTTEAIEMSVGRARMVGRDLTIHLAGPTAPGARSGQASTVLDRMELIYLDELVMPLENGGLWKPQSDHAEQDPADKQPGSAKAVDRIAAPAGDEAMISLACGGRVEYDFALDQLTLRETVSLIHHVPGHPDDRFDCSLLELTLNDPANDSIVRQTPMDWLTSIVAAGDPATARLPSFNAEIAAERIDFQASKGLVVAQGSKGIQLRRGGITARLARLVYQFDPKRPKDLGVVDVQGAGIVRIDDPKIPIRKAQWRDGVKIQPVGQTSFDDLSSNIQLWIDGEVHAWMSDGGEFKANAIFGELKPELVPGTIGEKTLAPDRFEISGDVRIDTAAIAAETQKLLLYFLTDPDPQPQPSPESASGQPTSLRQWVVQPRRPGDRVDPVARPRPTIRGDSIRAQLLRSGSQLSAKKLAVVGSVEVVHHLKTGEQTLPARLTGDQLQLIDGGGEDILQLTSTPDTPARFDLGDGYFLGPQIQVRPSDNLIWMNAAGEFQMPTAALPAGLSEAGTNQIKWKKAPHCRWKGQMIFDGRSAVLSDGVEITAALTSGRDHWDLQMTADRLQVDLVQAVQVRDVQAVRGATIQSVALMQSEKRPVLVQALRRNENGVLESRHLLHAGKLTLTPDNGGQLIGDGPGWYRGWMIPSTASGMFGTTTDAKPADSNSKTLTGIHLVFSDSMQGNMPSRQLEFLRGVRVGVRNVTSWEQTFEASAMDAISAGESTLDCDRLRFNLEPGYDRGQRLSGMPVPWEMEANSSVVFRTRNERGLLEATASRAAYSSSKDTFTVEGAPNQAAIFRQTRPDGSAGPEGAVRTMTVRPSSMTVENLVFERLNMATPAAGNTR